MPFLSAIFNYNLKTQPRIYFWRERYANRESSIESGAYSCRGGQEAMAPVVDWVDFFYGKSRLCWDCSIHQKCSVDLKYAKNALAAGAPPRTPLGELTTLPRPSSRLGGGHPLPNPHPSRRLWHLDSRAFGAQLRCPLM